MHGSAVQPVARQENAGAQAPFSTVAPLLGAALLLGVGGGFALASVLTLTRALRVPMGLWWAALAQAHGHLQLYGWAGFFVLGVALHFIPRLRGAALGHRRLLPWVVVAQVAGLLLRMSAQPLLAVWGVSPWSAVWRASLVASGMLEAVALGGILALFALLIRRGPPLRSRPALWGVLPLLAIAYAALALAAAVNLVNVVQAALGAPAGLVPAAGDNLNVTLGLLGFLVPMALAMSARSLPMYAGLEPFPRRVLRPAAAVYLLGLILSALGALAPAAPGGLAGLGLTLIGGVLLLFVVVFVRMIRLRGKLPARVRQLAPTPEVAARSYQTKVASERSAFGPYVALVASAYLWALLGGALMVVDGLALLLGASPPLALDAARHAIAVGFIALLICGIAPRMLPGFSGGRIASPRWVTATLWLGNAAVLLRVGSVLFGPALAALGNGGLAVSTLAFGLSGPVGLALAGCLAANLWPALRFGRDPTP
jgi:uncharacterized protein involved in response to NO